MDVSLVVKQRLSELGLDQKDLAAAIQVTDSYISQLLTRKKTPPAPARTDIYDRLGEFLKLPAGELSRLAEIQRQDDLKKRVTQPPLPLFKEWRELVLGKCESERRKEIQRIFEKEPFGELERLVTQKLLDAAQGISDVFDVSVESCVALLDTVIDSWDIDIKTFAMEVVMKSSVKRFEFVEQEPHAHGIEPGFERFLTDKSLSGDATEEEIEFLKRLKFKGRRPAALYYYRELQNLRDPLHFPASEVQ